MKRWHDCRSRASRDPALIVPGGWFFFRLPAPGRMLPPYIAIKKMTLAITECAAAAICQLWRTACANGANFRTGLQLHNRAANEATARRVLRQANASTKALTYTLARRQTKSYEDMAALGANDRGLRGPVTGPAGRSASSLPHSIRVMRSLQGRRRMRTGYLERCRRTS